ncbi:MAG: response regulator [Chloroflexota bacterium]|nr:response regulator [Chloroflexota bacterium]
MAARILLIAQDPAVQRTAAVGLRKEGYDLLTGNDGRDAARRVAVDGPDLVALEASLDGLDGYAAVEAIRAARAGEGGAARHLPIILIGEQADLESKIRALRAGADDYVAKPLHPAELSARARSLLVHYLPAEQTRGASRSGRVHAYYGAKGGVGTTTIAINTAIALHRDTRRSVVLVDANLQFGDHRVFLDLGPDKRSIVDACTAPAIDEELVRSVVVRHDSGIDLLLAPSAPEAAEHVRSDLHHLLQVVEVLRGMYDHVLVDLDKRLDDHTLDVIGATDTLFVVMTADLSCLKNVRLLLETLHQVGVPEERMELVLNRNNAYTGISVKAAEGVLRRKIEHQIVNDYRAAISSLNSGTPFMVNRTESAIGKGVLRFARAIAEPTEQSEPVRMRELVAVAD